mgnify:CR=1 FL=1
MKFVIAALIATVSAKSRDQMMAELEKSLPALEDGKKWVCGDREVPVQKTVLGKDGKTA